MLTIPRKSRWLSLLTFAYCVFVFFWLAPEDSIWLVSVLGWLMAILAAAHGTFRFSGQILPRRVWFPGLVASGAAVGIGAVAGTLLLMLMKTSLHGHGNPDYPFAVVSGIVDRLPAWTLGGALAGLGVALGLNSRQRQ